MNLADADFRSQVKDPAALVALVGHRLPVAHSAVLKSATNPAGLTAAERKVLKGSLLSSGIATTRIPDAFVALLLLVCGRRFGKSFLSTLLMIYDALFAGHWEHVLAGQRIMYPCVAPLVRQATETTRALVYWLDLLRPLGVAYERRDGNDQVEIVLTSPALPAVPVFSVFASNAVSLRGFPLGGLLLDEAGHFSPEEGNPASAREILIAAKPGQLQFRGKARTILAGTRGVASGLFFDDATKPPKGSLLIEASSWSSGFYSKEACEKEAIDSRHFEQEFQGRGGRWGRRDEQAIERWMARACQDAKRLGLRPRNAPRVLVIDFAPRRDATAVGIARHEVREGPEGVLFDDVLVEHVEVLQGSRENALLVDDVVERVVELRKVFKGIVEVHFDIFTAPEFHARFKKLGIKTVEIDVSAPAQTREWVNLFNLIRAKRIVLPPDERIVDQLAGLRITELPSGAWKVEGKKTQDDIADVLKRLAFRALTLPPSGSSVLAVHMPIRWSGHQLSGGGTRHFRRLGNGQLVPMDPPVGSPGFAQWAAMMKASGTSTPTLEKYWAENPEDDQPVESQVYVRSRFETNTRRSFGEGTPLADLAQVHEPERDAPPRGWVRD